MHHPSRPARRARALLAALLLATAVAIVLVPTSLAAVSVDAGLDVTVAEGSPFDRAVPIADDADGGDPGWSYAIDFGDGTPVVTGTALAPSIPVSHVFADGPAARTVAVTVTDTPGETAVDTFLVTVVNVPPTSASTGAAATTEGALYTLTLAATDPAGSADPILFAVDWGDGSLGSQVLIGPGPVGHVFTDDESGATNVTTRVIRVTAYDDADLSVQLIAVAVSNVAPVIALTGAASADVGVPYAVSLGALVDPGTDTATSIVLDWGDGTIQAATPATTVGHTYATGGSRTIQVVVTDEDGTFVAGSRPVSVVLRAPTAPTGLSATGLTRASVRLAWTNTSTTQTEVLVERCKGTGCTKFTQIASLAGSIAAYTDGRLSSNTTYVYRLRTRNAAGTSPYTAPVSARTLR
jgi:hypothetical protein